MKLDERRRTRLHNLDAYLGELETTLERGEVTVAASLASRILSDIPGMRPGMLIVDALDAVFKEQEVCLTENQTDPLSLDGKDRPSEKVVLPARVGLNHRDIRDSANTERPTMSESEARAITARIRSEYDNLCLLLLQAHEGRAWAALGYRSWHGYVHTEFGLSRSRSYELLDQGLVRRALQVATNSMDVPPVSARTAVSIKPVIGEMTRKIRERLMHGGAISNVVASEVLRETLTDLSSQRSRSNRQNARRGSTAQLSSGDTRPWPATTGSYDLETLAAAIEYFADMPPVAQLIGPLSYGALRDLARLPVAAQRLADLSSQWSLQLASVAKQADDLQRVANAG